MARPRSALYGGPGIVSGFDSHTPQRVSVDLERLSPTEPGVLIHETAPFFHPRWKPRASELDPLEEFAPGYLACAGHSRFTDVSLKYTYQERAKAGAFIALVLFDPHVPVLDRRAEEAEWIVWSQFVQGDVSALLNPSKDAVGIDSKGNLYFVTESPKVLRSGGYQWFVYSALTADVAPGDTITLFGGGDYLFLGEREEEEEKAVIWTPNQRQWDQQVERELEVAYAKNEAPVAPGEPLRTFIDQWFQFREGVLQLDGLFAQNVKGPIGYYAYGAVWYKAGGAPIAFEDPGEGGGLRRTIKGEGDLPLDVITGDFDLLAIGDWTLTATPDGGIWDNLLSASVEGNHMVVDRLPPGGVGSVTHNGVGTGVGYVGMLSIVGLDVPSVVTGTPSLTATEFVDDETFGRGGGALMQPGKRLTVQLDGTAWSADAGHLEDGEDITGAVAPLFNYFTWPTGVPLVRATWASTVFTEVRRVWRELSKGKRMPMPALAEVRVSFRVTAHTDSRWRMFGDAGEDAYAAGYMLGVEGEALHGEVWVGGVKAREGALECTAAEAAAGVEFVVREDLRDGLGEAGKEKYAEWRNPLGEEGVGVYATAGSLFNTLGFDWAAAINLYQPPPDEEYPGGPQGMTAIVESPVLSLSYTRRGVTETKEAEEAREREEREQREKEAREREEKRAEERAKEKEELERLEKQREEEKERRKEREEKGEPESEEEKRRREQRELEERKIREERELREELEAEEREEGGGGEGPGGSTVVGEGMASGTVSRNRNPR